MKKAIVTLWGKYKYPVELEDNCSFHDAAMAISLAVHRKEGKTKFTERPRSFNYIYECLLRKSCLNFRLNSDSTYNNDAEMLKAVNELNSKSEWIKVICPECKAQGMTTEEPRGFHLFGACTKCNGHGYIYEKQEYRLGYTQNKVLIIDVDGKDEYNLNRVKMFYENVLNCKFTVISTKKGYWLFSDKKYDDLDSWIFDHCRVLCPILTKDCYPEWKKKLLALDEDKKGEFHRATPEVIKESGLYKVPTIISFDVAFTFLSIKRERSTIRYTKKGKDDKIEVLNL
jgi:hypothetical protein